MSPQQSTRPGAAEEFDARPELYDALIDWERRLANETPFYRRLFDAYQVGAVLDAACGTGRHAAMFHSWGLEVEGADLSPAMIEAARRQFPEGPRLRWVVRGFDSPTDRPGHFDAAICVGNSLALARDPAHIKAAMAAMVAAIRPGGIVVIQVLNLWSLADGPVRWQKCKRIRLDGSEHVVVKGVHRAGGRGYVSLIDLRLNKGGVEEHFASPSFLGIQAEELADATRSAGAEIVETWGGIDRTPYDRASSVDLIVVCRRAAGART